MLYFTEMLRTLVLLGLQNAHRVPDVENAPAQAHRSATRIVINFFLLLIPL
jgi:hypothetical protein